MQADGSVIAIAATFTAEPVEESLAFWLSQLGVSARVQFAPFNQVFQQLVDPTSDLAGNKRGLNVLLVRFEDWQQRNDDVGAADAAMTTHVDQFIATLSDFAARALVPTLVVLCPPSLERRRDSTRQSHVAALETTVNASLAGVSGVTVATSEQLHSTYPVGEIDDPHGDCQGSVPYTPAFYVALGTLIARQFHAVLSSPRKVIVLDCDGTLWDGVVGEEGVSGVRIDAHRQAIQSFLAARQQAGMLLALASKNNEADVLEVFDRRPEMRLRREHLVGWRVNWNPKSDNLSELAAELGLSLESFIFVDDNPVECAEVAANCPGVLTVLLPSEPEHIPAFLEHHWAFDQLRTTGEDLKRTELYRQNAQREQTRQSSSSLQDFLRGLQIEVEIADVAAEHLPRAAQLTQRTNQFNLTTIRRTDAELRAAIQGGVEGRVVSVRDRFGDYGLVGVVLFAARSDALDVDTFLLSCRALGRGVEHQVLAYLGKLARERGIACVDLPFVRTPRNQPAHQFLERVGTRFRVDQDGVAHYRLPAAVAASVTVEDEIDLTSTVTIDEVLEPASETTVTRTSGAVLARIATFASNLDLVEEQIVARRRQERPDREAPVILPRTQREHALARIWSRVLGIADIGVTDSFFDLGGDSLRAMELIARARATLGIEISLQHLFEQPTIKGLLAAVDTEAGDGDGRDGPSPAFRPEPGAELRPFPLTDIQQAYWVGRNADFELGNVSSHNYTEIDFVDLDLDRLTAAWRRLIDRHAMLRAVVRPDGQQQILHDVPPYEIAVLDLRGLPAATVEPRLVAVRDAMSHQVRPLDQWPLFEIRATLLDERRTRVHYSIDLMIADAASLLILGRELNRLYEDPVADLDPIEMSFRDYVVSTSAFQDTPSGRRARVYWLKRLDSLPPPPELPLAVAPGALGKPRFERRGARLEGSTWQQLKERASRYGLSAPSVLLAAYAEVLGAWSKNPRFSINVTLFNRLPVHPQVNAVVGDFTSVDLLAADVRAADDFMTRARRLQARLWEDLDHRLFSGVQVLRELARTSGSGRQTIMPVVFTSTIGLTGPGQDAVPFAMGGEVGYAITQTPQVWLDNQVSERDGDLVVNWDAVEDLFPAGLVSAMLESYTSLLWRLAEADASWQDNLLTFLPADQSAQRQRVNDTAAPAPAGLLQDRVLEQAARRPHDLAVIAPTQRLTYGDLARLSTHLGHRLRDLGARPNHLVAVVMEKGWEQVVAVLGILQAGGAYLPIDPNLPAERLNFLLEYGQVELVLTQSWIDEKIAWPEGVRRLDVDRLDPQDLYTTPLEPIQTADDLAYVIFTSGSTGLPKGVMIDHRGALNTCVDVNERFAVGPDDRVLALSSLSFDLSVWDVFGLLAAGGAIVFPEAKLAREPEHWAELVRRERVTIWNTVPALMQMLTDHVANQPELWPGSLRLVMMSGDWIPLHLPDEIKRQAPSARVVSLGGATEASIWSILYPIERIELEWKSVPYGRPMLNQTFHVLNDALEPCPVWVPGQLYIGGIGLAKGYWRDARKTNASFFVHPRTGERLYRTGDLGRYLPDGNIEFLGREDFQVKVQGFRIELGEIEVALIQHPAVKDAVVVARAGERIAGDRVLVGYVVPKDGSAVNGSDLRDFLKAKLPPYMVPAVIVALDRLPLTSNGKVDRKALPAPDLAASERDDAYQAPRTDLERELAAMWADVLGIDEGATAISVHDNFFDLGGHSLLAVRLFTAIEKKLGKKLPLATLFQSPTIAELAKVLSPEIVAPGPKWTSLVPIQPNGTKPPFFCVHGIGGGVLDYARLAELLGPDQPFYGLQSRQLAGVTASLLSMEQMAAYYLEEVRAVQPLGPYYLGGYCYGGVVAYEMARQLQEAGQTVALVAMLEQAAPAYRQVHWSFGFGGRFVRNLAWWFLDCREVGPRGVKSRVLRYLRLSSDNVKHRLLGRSGKQQPLRLEDYLDDVSDIPEDRRQLILLQALAFRDYQPKPYDGHVVVYRTRSQPVFCSQDNDLSWGRLVQGRVKVCLLRGTHGTILMDPFVQDLAEKLRGSLAEAESASVGQAGRSRIQTTA